MEIKEKLSIEGASDDLLERWIAESHVKEDSLNRRIGDLDQTKKIVLKMVESRKGPLTKAISSIMKNRNQMIDELSKRKNSQPKI